MDYKYLLEQNANKNIEFDDLKNEKDVCVLNILCYHIADQQKYPFLQFMMEKVPYCHGFVKEELTLPCVFVRNSSDSVKNIVLDKIKSGLQMLNCDYNKVTDEMYKGILFNDECLTPFALVNITGIDIYGLNFTRQTLSWFVLPSEIINTKKACNIEIDNEVTRLFTDIPKISLLTDSKTNTYYILPDAVYTGNELKQSEFNSIFGNRKSQAYSSCGEYYYFYRIFENAVKDGGWVKDGNSNKIGERVIVEKDSKKFINGCINRYALFVEGKIYFETQNEFSLSDNIIENLYPEPCIIICYTAHRDVKPDVLVKTYESFVCLSYHKLNKSLLDEQFIDNNKHEYMIA